MRRKPEKSPRSKILPEILFFPCLYVFVIFAGQMSSTYPKPGACCHIKEKREQWECPQGGPQGPVSHTHTRARKHAMKTRAAGDLIHQHPLKILIFHLPAKRMLINHSHTQTHTHAPIDEQTTFTLTSWPCWLERLSKKKKKIENKLPRWWFIMIRCRRMSYKWKLDEVVLPECCHRSFQVPILLHINMWMGKNHRNRCRIVLACRPDCTAIFNTKWWLEKKKTFVLWFFWAKIAILS